MILTLPKLHIVLIILQVISLLHNKSAEGNNYRPKSKLEFSNGYKNILVGITPQIDPTKCISALNGIRSILSFTSSLLFSATLEKAAFSSVTILLPFQCTYNGTMEVATASATETYIFSDLKVTDQNPLATSLPYTRQYKGCGLGSEDILIPLENFLLSDSFTTEIKGAIMLHYWAKFRYGVFDEHGYLKDPLYPACYMDKGTMRFTSCSDAVLPSLSDSPEGVQCRHELENRKGDILAQLLNAKSSVMSIPHLQSVAKFCTNETHNKYASTKQNIHCDGESVADVIFKHPDFLRTRKPKQGMKAPPPPTFRIVQHNIGSSKLDAGYAFIIDVGASIREGGRLRLIKQTLSTIVDLLPFSSMAALSTFQGGLYTLLTTKIKLDSVQKKAEFIRNLPDIDSLGLAEKINQSRNLSSNKLFTEKVGAKEFNFRDTLSNVIQEIQGERSYNWNIVLVTSSPPSNSEDAKNVLHASSVGLTVVTFEDEPSPQWLTMYGSQNMKNILTLPGCNQNPSHCSELSAWILDDFMETLRWNDVPIYWHHLLSRSIEPGTVSNVRIDLLPEGAQFRFFITTFEPSSNIVIYAPNGNSYNVTMVHGYPYLLSASIDHLEVGDWRVDLSALPSSSLNSQVTILMESLAEDGKLNVFSSMERLRENELMPNSEATIVYSRVSDPLDRPVLNAEIELLLYSSKGPVGSPTVLKDDGNYPDLVQDDGVYSAALQDLASTPTFHSGRVEVTTKSGSTSIVTSIQSPEAALLDGRMESKCCGSSIPVGSTLLVGNGRITSLLSSFKTSEAFNKNLLPPQRIGTLRVVEDDGQRIVLQFNSPALPGGSIPSHYETCCIFVHPSSQEEISSCAPIVPRNECLPSEASQPQSCIIYKDHLKHNHIVQTDLEQTTIFLRCTLRAVNALGVSGPKSVGIFEVALRGSSPKFPRSKLLKGGNISEYDSNSSNDCHSISDGCLPIYIFWGLIGCIGGMLIIIFLLVLCWCLSSRKKKKAGSSQEVLMSKNKKPNDVHEQRQEQRDNAALESQNAPLNVYVNRAYIKESDGQLKLVATDGNLLPLDRGGLLHRHNPHQFHQDNVSEMDPIATRFLDEASSPSSPIAPIAPIQRRSEGIFDETKGDMVLFKAKPQPPPKPIRPSTINVNNTDFEAAATVPVPRNRGHKMDTGYANGGQQQQSSSPTKHYPPAPLKASVLGIRPIEDPPVYASVNRNGRNRTPPEITNGFSTFRPSTSRSSGTSPGFQPSSKDDSHLLIRNRFIPTPRSGSQPPVVKKLDIFPSSESETYSRGLAPTAPPPPPPFPASPAGSKSLPVRRMLSPPSYKPPPPPPPHQHKQRNMGNESSDEEYDDDSEHWDDEDFDFKAPNPGVSFA